MDNQLKAKNQDSLFHLYIIIRNREAGRIMLSLTWNGGVHVKHCDYPVYLGVVLDQTLSYI